MHPLVLHRQKTANDIDCDLPNEKSRDKREKESENGDTIEIPVDFFGKLAEMRRGREGESP